MGRPSSYTPEIAEGICELVALGSNLERICKEDGQPDKASVYKWFRLHPEFFNDYTRAREMRAETRSDRIDGYCAMVLSGELGPNEARVIIDTEKWQAGKESPKKYGDATLLKHGDHEGNVLKVQISQVTGTDE